MTFEAIRAALVEEDEAYYESNGVLDLVSRGMATKSTPQRWQAEETDVIVRFDAVICFEDRLFEVVVADLLNRQPRNFTPLHIFSVDTKDTAHDAVSCGATILDLVRKLEAADDIGREIPASILQSDKGPGMLYQLCYL